MTFLPHENRDVVGLEGPTYPKYKVGPLCCSPAHGGCSRIADHSHHIWRRSFLGGDFAWVRLWDGTITGNLCALCYEHHNLITENRARIAYHTRADGEAKFWWVQDVPNVGIAWIQLKTQPPIWTPRGAAIEEARQFVDGMEPHQHVGPAAVEKCPTCRRAMPREKSKKRETARRREKWSITVPKDERENGADVLDTLLIECAKIFGHDETKALRYFTLSQALALVVQHGDRMVGNE